MSDRVTGTLASRTAVYIALIAGSVVFLLPLAWMLSTSLKPQHQLFVWPPVWIPEPVQWDNYPKALTFLPFGLFIRNTMIIEVFVVSGTVIASSLVAYGFAKMSFVGRDFLFMVLLATMMLPRMVTLIPMFVVYSRLRLVDTWFPLIVPAFFGIGRPHLIFLTRQFFYTIPDELLDAARIDGCSEIRIWWRIMLPLSLPVLSVVAIITFQLTWNDFIEPLVYLNTLEKKTVALGLQQFLSLEGGSLWNQLMAATAVTVLPILGVFILFQRFFVQGIVLTGLK